MAMKVTDDCTGCGYRISRCPVQAITIKDDGLYEIDPSTCVECEGYNEGPTCVEVCSVGCIEKAMTLLLRTTSPVCRERKDSSKENTMTIEALEKTVKELQAKVTALEAVEEIKKFHVHGLNRTILS